jgi:hypothetical protein
MHPAEFEPAIPAGERPQTLGLDHSSTGIGKVVFFFVEFPDWGIGLLQTSSCRIPHKQRKITHIYRLIRIRIHSARDCVCVCMYVYIYIYIGSLSPRHGAFSGCGWRNGQQIWRVAANILNEQSRTAEKSNISAWGLGEVLTTPYRKKN